MTAHELAKKLLEGPDLPVTRLTEGEDNQEVSSVSMWTEPWFTDEYEQRNDTHIHLS